MCGFSHLYTVLESLNSVMSIKITQYSRNHEKIRLFVFLVALTSNINGWLVKEKSTFVQIVYIYIYIYINKEKFQLFAKIKTSRCCFCSSYS